MIEIDPEIRSRVSTQYETLCRAAGTRKAATVLRHLTSQLPYPVEIHNRPASAISHCTVTGQAHTDTDAGRHHISIAHELRGGVRTHTMAHELYHLAFHRADQANIEELLDYYLTLPDLSGVPRSIARAAVFDALSSPLHRDGTASSWEQEAECFALMVVSNSALITRPRPRSALIAALGDIYHAS